LANGAADGNASAEARAIAKATNAVQISSKNPLE
jgi:hypothetical protein